MLSNPSVPDLTDHSYTRLLCALQSMDIRNSEGNTALHWACLNGHKHVVQYLMDKGASAAVVNTAGRTPVDEALSRDFQEIFDLVKDYGTAGADVTVEVEETGTGQLQGADGDSGSGDEDSEEDKD